MGCRRPDRRKDGQRKIGRMVEVQEDPVIRTWLREGFGAAFQSARHEVDAVRTGIEFAVQPQILGFLKAPGPNVASLLERSRGARARRENAPRVRVDVLNGNDRKEGTTHPRLQRKVAITASNHSTRALASSSRGIPTADSRERPQTSDRGRRVTETMYSTRTQSVLQLACVSPLRLRCQIPASPPMPASTAIQSTHTLWKRAKASP